MAKNIIGDLSRTFNQMAGEIEKNQKNLGADDIFHS
jgi:hypothetical protein